eukprot:scaffold34943_cov351-Amphora_coffeaeformis.AAC.1
MQPQEHEDEDSGNDNDKLSKTKPQHIRIRHIAPYWIRVQLILSRHKYQHRTIGQALEAIKTKFPDAQWWRTKLNQGQLDWH